MGHVNPRCKCHKCIDILYRVSWKTLWLVSLVVVLAACRNAEAPPVRRALPKEILVPPTRTVERITRISEPDPATPSKPAATPSTASVATPTPVPAMKRLQPAALPPERIVAPAIDLDAPVVPMPWRNVVRDGQVFTEWEVPSYAAGFQIGSAFPGQPGNTVISAHHNIEGRVFENLWKLVPGDSVFLYTAENVFRYVVEESFLLREQGVPPEQRRQNAVWIGPSVDERLTLVTCWPPDGNAYRLIVIAKPAEVLAAQDLNPNP